MPVVIYKEPDMECKSCIRVSKRNEDCERDYRCQNLFVEEEFIPLGDWVIRCPVKCGFILSEKRYLAKIKKAIIKSRIVTRSNMFVSYARLIKEARKLEIDTGVNSTKVGGFTLEERRPMLARALAKFGYEKMLKVPKSLKKKGKIWFIKRRV